jgi:hypothetical protein
MELVYHIQKKLHWTQIKSITGKYKPGYDDISTIFIYDLDKLPREPLFIFHSHMRCYDLILLILQDLKMALLNLRHQYKYIQNFCQFRIKNNELIKPINENQLKLINFFHQSIDNWNEDDFILIHLPTNKIYGNLNELKRIKE